MSGPAFQPTITRPPLQGRGVVPRLVSGARATSGDVAGSFAAAYDAVMATRDPKKAATQLGAMKTALDALRQAKSAELPAYEEKFDAASRRLAALPYLYGLPDVPRPKVTRDPASSAERATAAQATAARAFEKGYQGGGATQGFSAMLAKWLPYFFKQEATPAFTKLPEAQQAAFLRCVHESTAKGQLALHDMLVKGTLTPALLTALDGLAGDRLASGVDRALLFSQVVTELSDPVTISQRSRGTCAATTVQMLIAMRSPELYVSLVRGLASVKGDATLPSGDVISRERDWDATNDGGRSLSSRLLQPSLMEFANGARDYLNTEDVDVDPVTKAKAPSGLESFEAARLLASVSTEHRQYDAMGATYVQDLPATTLKGLDETLETPHDMLMILQDNRVIDEKSQATILDGLRTHATPTDPVYATVIYTLYPTVGRVGFHAVLVTGVKDGMVNYINPWGQEESLSEKLFKQSVVSVDLPAQPAEASPAAAKASSTAPKAEAKAAKPAATVPSDEPTREFLTKAGDTLRGIARRQLGSERRWQQIVALNVGQFPSLATHPDRIQPGWKLLLPA